MVNNLVLLEFGISIDQTLLEAGPAGLKALMLGLHSLGYHHFMLVEHIKLVIQRLKLRLNVRNIRSLDAL